ncbi:hypothetical protein ACFUV2_25255 [Streptomyces pilosus]|uniref:hypothetical protein n=1 Tax=Streptomyces pilosus TaxID=28893 RepID=UPI00363514DC
MGPTARRLRSSPPPARKSSATTPPPHAESPRASGTVRRHRFFPVGNGEAIAREIPAARLLILEDAATAIPDAAVGEVAEAMLTLG